MKLSTLNVLEYARPDASKRWRPPISGVISFAALALWLPWGYGWFFVFWAYPRSPTASPTPLECNALGFICSLPVLVAFVFGCYSMKTAGITMRNILGVIGLIVSGAWIGLCIVGFCLSFR